MNEVHLTILGFRVRKFAVGVGVWYVEGTPASVVMDIRNPLKWKKWLLGFYHTHPKMLNYPSGIDKATFYTWGNCLGKPLYFLIDGLDAESFREREAIANYKTTCYPYENISDKIEYVGHAYKIYRFFFWKEM